MNPENFDAEIATYARTDAPVLILAFEKSGQVLWSGDYIRKVLGGDPSGLSFTEIFARTPTDSSFDTWRPPDNVETNLDLRLPGNLPQTWRIVFRTRENLSLALGRRDNAEVEGLETNLLSLNAELSNRTRELHKANAELKRLDTLKNRFLGMAAHDLRTPLGVILAYSELLEDEVGSSMEAEHREFVSTIRESSDFMLQLVNDLLDVATIESGKLAMDRKPVDLPTVLAKNLSLNQLLAARKNIQIVFAPPDEFPTVLLDRMKFEQVMNNLLGNAVKFSPPDSTITVRLEQHPNQAKIYVSDEGPGIPPEKINQLGQPFARLGTRTPNDEPGTGLGLLIVRKIIEGHGGRLHIVPAERSGTTFVLELPLSDGRGQSSLH
ncbi:MAG: HAMP domain-containing histidine kinase [Opitutales bacterium]|nr:HAMP domain-containing histidine kinase [Opitutales bacterium]MCH8540053.1 HAMP domain-containing histidine kinase [Opitutales bacterium]